MATTSPTSSLPPLALSQYPEVRESYISTYNLTYHVLSAGNPKHPLILCLHGFPELAYSYRKVLGPIAAAGYHVVAYDQRGYGRTTGWDTRSFEDVNLDTFKFSNIVLDAVVLVRTLGYHEVACVIGNDFGGLIASLCALIRPDIFKSTIIMTHPFKGTTPIPLPTTTSASPLKEDIHTTLANLNPPRKHYKWYYATSPAASDLVNPPQGLSSLFRGYFHLKSADWPGNDPKPLKSWTATVLEQLPLYYIMPLNASMGDSVTQDSASSPPDPTIFNRWLPEDELAVFVQEFGRTGFQGGLNWYRVHTNDGLMEELRLYSGKTIDVPIMFISGKKDWGAFQDPGALDQMEKICTQWKGAHFLDGAGHWVQQEQPEKVVELVLNFLKDI